MQYKFNPKVLVILLISTVTLHSMTPEAISQELRTITPGQLSENRYNDFIQKIGRLPATDVVKGELFMQLEDLRTTPSQTPSRPVPRPAFITKVPPITSLGQKPTQQHPPTAVQPLTSPTTPAAIQMQKNVSPTKAYDELKDALEENPVLLENIQEGIRTLEETLKRYESGWQPSPVFKRQIDDLLQQALQITQYSAAITQITDQLQQALTKKPFEIDPTQTLATELQNTLQQIQTIGGSIPLTVTGPASNVLKEALQRITEEKNKINHNRQQQLISEIEHIIKATTEWNDKTYNQCKTMIEQLADPAQRAQYKQQLEKIWQQDQAQKTTAYLIQTVVDWTPDIYSSIRSAIDTTITDKRVQDLIKKQLDTAYQTQQTKASLKIRPTHDICVQVKKITETSSEETLNKLIEDLHDIQYALPPIQPINAALQSGPDGGGALSCGYHALKNGIYTVRALRGLTSWESLLDLTIVKNLFGEQGTWRKRIIDIQNYRFLTAYIAKELKNSYLYPKAHVRQELQRLERSSKQADNEQKADLGWIRTRDVLKVREVYATVLQRMAEQLASTLIHDATRGADTHKTTISPATIVNTITTTIQTNLANGSIAADIESFAQGTNKKRIPGDSDAEKAMYVARYLQKMSTIETYIKMDAPSRIFSNSDIAPAQQYYQTTSRQEPGLMNMITRGDYIQADKIDMLARHEQQPGNLLDPDILKQRVDVTTVNHVKNIDSALFFELKKIASRYAQETPFIHIFCINTPGHWFSLVVHKDAPESTHYFIADSLGNPHNFALIAKPIVHVLEILKDCTNNRA